ncbi:disease resistance protein RPV1-like [Malus sylvestris]|uniref:disease resistance protein RPV1-like n=1 Tax=Malus sylvestris TaxID=3752 RepID=UPI0021AC3EFF|nr:disease resistance protein RPV1-like [Malus sylvestris]
MALLRSAAFKDSNSSSQRCYHVFLSFRGEDTRKTFTDHLYTALVNAGFQTFRDNDELEREEDIKPELEKAIRQSQTCVIVFSKEYASSRWCLDELLIILERKRTNREFVVLPVFYDVDPSHLRKQTGSFAEAFSRHQSAQSSSKVSRWRAALAQVADLAGMVLPNQADGYESKFIKKIVKVIEGKLRRVTPLSVSPKLIGIQSRAKRIDSWLKDGSTDVGVLVLYGISGVGKTTIAKSVYNSNFRRFEGRSFVENIRELSEQPNGLVQIQKHLLSDILNGRNVEIHSVSEGVSKVEDAIRSKRVLLILDDVDHTNQLDAVFRMKHCFYPGSKIIITTRRAKLLKPQQVSEVHNVEPLSYNESMELFSWHAFEQDHPVDGFMKHSEEVVDHCGGLPLALRVLGSSLMGESITVWQSTLEKLKAIPDGQIMKKLRSSYDSLQDNHDRDLFLHIACFFVGKDKDCVVRILDDCQFYTVVGIQNLVDRCLVTIHQCEWHKYCKIQMHDLVRDMGREIVRSESEEPEKRSRLWHHKDSFKVLREKNGTQTICGLVLNMFPADTTSMNSDEMVFETEAFTRMHKLKLLHLSHVQLNGSYAEFPTELRWLCWHEFSLNSIPINFPLENLVVLEMHHSCLRQVWKGTKCLPSLKILDLSHSHDLRESVADFSLFPNLEKLILVDCRNLIDVHESIESLEKLVYLNMKDCKSIRMLNKNIGKLKLLKTLIISGCSNLNESSVDMMRNMESLKVLEADEIPVNQVLTAGGQLIESWSARSSYIFWTSLPRSLVSLSLSGRNLSNEDFPMELGNLSSLEKLNLQSTSVCSLPSCIKGLKKLCELNFGGCKSLKELVGLPKVKHVFVTDCTSLEKVTYESFSSYKNSLVLFRHNRSLVEAEYTFRLEPIGKVDTEMINLLELRNYLESTATIKMHVPFSYGKISQDYESRPIQGLYEYGIFSTFLPGNQVPGRFGHRSSDAGTSISCRVPSLPPNYVIRGLNIFAVYALSEHSSFHLFDNPLFKKVWNKSKSLKWIYNPQVYGIPREGEAVAKPGFPEGRGEIQKSAMFIETVAFTLESTKF